MSDQGYNASCSPAAGRVLATLLERVLEEDAQAFSPLSSALRCAITMGLSDFRKQEDARLGSNAAFATGGLRIKVERYDAQRNQISAWVEVITDSEVVNSGVGFNHLVQRAVERALGFLSFNSRGGQD